MQVEQVLVLIAELVHDVVVAASGLVQEFEPGAAPVLLEHFNNVLLLFVQRSLESCLVLGECEHSVTVAHEVCKPGLEELLLRSDIRLEEELFPVDIDRVDAVCAVEAAADGRYGSEPVTFVNFLFAWQAEVVDRHQVL